jgi:predicted dehydrogenase
MPPRTKSNDQIIIRVGLVGFGLAGSVFHAPLITATPALRLTTIVTSNDERRRQAVSEYPDATIVPTDDLFARAQDLGLDLIVVASPNKTHVPLATAALRAGLHVVVDKPFAPTAAEARALIAEARRADRLITVFQNRRWDGDFLTLRRLLQENALGDALRMESRFERWRPVPKPGWKESGGEEDATGVLYDLGSHLIDQALALFGPVTHVYAELERRRATSEVVDDAFVALAHASGVWSHLHTNMISAEPGPRFRVLGARASYTKFGLDVQEDALRNGARPGDRGWGEERPEQWGTLSDGEMARRVPTERGAYESFYARVAAAVRGEGPLPVDPEDAVATATVIEAALLSARERSAVPIESAMTAPS